MSKNPFSAHPNLLGFEQLENLFTQSISASGDSFPPYNIEQTKDDEYLITLAVAGYKESQLSVIVEGTQLLVRAKKLDTETADYLYQGIAARQFERRFVLAKGVSVTNAHLENGLLTVTLVQKVLEDVSQKIEITPR